MTGFADIFQAKNLGPYAKPIRAKVVANGEVSTYTYNNEEKKCLAIALSDGSRVVRGVAYDQFKFVKLKVGNSVVLRDVISKTEDGIDTVVITKSTKVFMTMNIETPASHEEDGKKILNPPPAAVKSLKEALQSPTKQKVSVLEKIVQVNI